MELRIGASGASKWREKRTSDYLKLLLWVILGGGNGRQLGGLEVRKQKATGKGELPPRSRTRNPADTAEVMGASGKTFFCPGGSQKNDFALENTEGGFLAIEFTKRLTGAAAVENFPALDLIAAGF